MPTRKNYKPKRRRRRRYRKKRVPRQLITNRVARTFKYCETFSLNPGAGTAAINTFSANGMYDPNVTGVGHQPLGFDQLVGVLYDQYTVIGAKCKATFSTTGSSGTLSQFRVGIAQRDTSGYSGTGTLLIEQGRTNWTTVAPLGGASQKSVTSKMSIGKFLGRSAIMADSDLKGDSGNNPIEQGFFIVWAAGIDDTEDGGAVFCTVEIEYLAVLHEPKLLASS